MKKIFIFRQKMLIGAAMIALAFGSCQRNDDLFRNESEETLNDGDIIPGEYIVKFKNSTLPNGRFAVGDYEEKTKAMGNYAEAFMKKAGIGDAELMYSYVGDFSGFAVRMSEAEAKLLQNSPEVEYTEPNRRVVLDDPEIQIVIDRSSDVGIAAQSIPWGIAKVGGAGNGTGKRAWIIDTGIDLDHPDLNVSPATPTGLSKSFISGLTPEDGHGHGTHVSGTIAAKNDDNGVVGVAAGATVIAVKVLDNSGSGSDAGVIAGVNYVTANGTSGDVANLSLGGGASTSLDNAVIALGAKGVKVSIAAGNSAKPAKNYSPSRANGINLYTVSAFGQGNSGKDNVFASFSNYGKGSTNDPIEWSEPGVSVYSCYKNAGYATMSGTSMAAPHLAGILLIGGVKSHTTTPTVIGDKDVVADKIGVRQ